MKMLNTLTSSAYHDLIDYNVVDQGGGHVGTLHSLWSDQNTGALEFLGVKTGWLFGKNHVVPASQAQIDEDNRFVQIPFAADFIKEAPSIAADAEITEDQEAEIYRYYNLSGEISGSSTATTSADTTPATTISDLGRAGTAATVGTGVANAADYATREVEAGGARLRKLFRPEADTAETTTAATGYEPTGTGFVAPGDRTNAEFASGSTRHPGDANPDLITGEPGSHPVGTAIGGVSGAATGAAVGGAGAAAMGATFGAAAGPVGAVIGGVAGAVVGGLVGKGVEEHFDPTEEAAYWQQNYRSSSNYDPSLSYEEYEPAYRSGYTGFGKYYGTGKRFDEVEGDIRRDYEGSGARLAYDKARDSVKAAYDRLFNRASSGQRR